MVAQASTIRRIITAGLLLAITLLLVFTRVGLLPMPTPAGNATIAHIPAIIAGVLEGPLVGLLVGLGFGVASFANAAVPMFKDPSVAILPRIFIGLTSAYTFMLARRASRRGLQIMFFVLVLFLLAFSFEMGRTSPWLGILGAVVSLVGAYLAFRWMQTADVQVVAVGMACAVGSLTNTVLVLTAAVLRDYLSFPVAVGVGITHGVPEVAASVILTIAIVAALRQLGTRERGSRL